MRQIPFIIILLGCLFNIQASYAQETVFEQTTTIYSSEKSGGLGMHTAGFVGTYRYATYLTGFTKRVYEIEIANIKHPKEVKSINPFENDLKGYVYGKKNGFYTLRPSIGFHKVFIPKQSVRGVSITYVTHLGASLGLAKPVYLNIREVTDNDNVIIARRRYDPDKHDQDDIYGKASFLNGMDEITLYPGLFVKAGLQFDFANDREVVKALEIGLKTDIYFSNIPIMAYADNQAYFLNIYLQFYFGGREVE